MTMKRSLSPSKRHGAGLMFAVLAVLLMTLPYPLHAVGTVCPTTGATRAETQVIGFDNTRRFTEISGLALSPTQVVPGTKHPVMYVINDGNDNGLSGGRVGMYDSGTGKRLLTLDIANTTIPSNFDWEAMAIGTCGPASTLGSVEDTCIYIADTGDNVARDSRGNRTERTENDPYRLIKFREPSIDNLPMGVDTMEIPASDVSMLSFNYLHSTSPTPVADCEAIILDPKGWGEGGQIGDVYVVTKWDSRDVWRTRLFKIPASVWPDFQKERTQEFTTVSSIFRRAPQPVVDIYSPTAISVAGEALPRSKADVGGGDGDFFRNTWTGADATRDGTVIALTTYYDTWLFLRCPGSTVAEALLGSSKSCHSWKHPSPGQVETFAWTADGNATLQIPEGARPRMGWTTMIYNYTDSPDVVSCPKLEWALREEGVSYCRTVEDKIPLPDDWCYYADHRVPFLYEQKEEELNNVSATDGSAPDSEPSTRDFNTEQVQVVEIAPTPAVLMYHDPYQPRPTFAITNSQGGQKDSITTSSGSQSGSTGTSQEARSHAASQVASLLSLALCLTALLTTLIAY